MHQREYSQDVITSFSSVQLLSHVWLLQPHGLQHTRLPCPLPTPGACLFKLKSNTSVTPSNHLILCHSLLLPSSFPASGSFPRSQVFAKVLEFQLQHQSFQLISLKMDWLELLAVQGTLKSLLQHHSRKASILWCLAFFTVQLTHPYMTTGKTIALTRRATPRQRSGVAAERSYPTSKERRLHGCRRAERSYSMFKVRKGDSSKVRSSSWALLEKPWRDTPHSR